MEDNQCIFSFLEKCSAGVVKPVGSQRRQTVIKYAKEYKHEDLEKKLCDNPDCLVYAHHNCISTYTSKLHLARAKQKREHSNDRGEELSKSKRRSLHPKFDFKKYCVFCGENCILKPDPKHPDRWRPAYQIRTAMKATILQTCKDRNNDEWAEQVELRIHGAISDLHAKDARYHVDCYNKFRAPKSIKNAAASTTSEEKDEAFIEVIKKLDQEQSQMRNSVEISDLFISFGGTVLPRRTLVSKLVEHYGPDKLLVLSSTGVASILVFREKASNVVKLAPDESDLDALDNAVKILQKHIKREVEEVELNKEKYTGTINRDIALNETSSTLMMLLSKLAKDLSGLPGILIGNMITSTIKQKPTTLQVALGISLEDSKELIQDFYKWRVTCSYDETRRFRKSAAHANVKRQVSSAIQEGGGLVQVVADNFDCDIFSMNGKLSTHSLAMLVSQQKEPNADPINDERAFRRITKDEMKEEINYHIDTELYKGQKKPSMPEIKQNVPPLSALVMKVVGSMLASKAKQTDYQFFYDMAKEENCPEYKGYNTKRYREQGQCLKPSTTVVYLPLIDMPPADPSTMMTALKEAQKQTKKAGQEYTVVTYDLQLYRISLFVIWSYPEQFNNVVLRLGGMHTLMSFIGAVGTLMAGTGLSEILSSVFGGVQQMLLGKKYLQNFRAIIMLAEEVIGGVIVESNSVADFDNQLEKLCERSKTCKLWVKVFLRAVFIMMVFLRAEREAEWTLHLEAVQLMIPYFFAASHIHYARYCLYYLRSMVNLPKSVLQAFLKGEHVMRHRSGIWNAIWSDQFIESTFMRYGKAKGGIIGITLKPEALKTWSLSLHTTGQLLNDLSEMTSSDSSGNEQVSHKEESSATISKDEVDRKGLREQLLLCINPLDPDEHPDKGIIDIYSGRISAEQVNVDDEIHIGTQQMRDFEAGWPSSFHETIPRKVITMAETKRHIKVADTMVFNTELIYSRVMGLQDSGRNVDKENLLSHELSPVPASMFIESGEMRAATSKNVLKNTLKVELSKRKTDISSLVVDASAALWVTPWPLKGTIQDYIEAFLKYTGKLLENSHVYMIFDRYYDFSIKSSTRGHRTSAAASRRHTLRKNMKLPARNILLTSTHNKIQLIQMIVDEFKTNLAWQQKHTSMHRIVVTGPEEAPVEISHGGLLIERKDIATTHEEADVILVQQAIQIAKESRLPVSLVCDDTDVFVLMLHFYAQEGITTQVFMESPVKERTTIDIGATVKQHDNIIPDLLAAHAISGCDTVACLFGIGKTKAINCLKKGKSLFLLGTCGSDIDKIVEQCTEFISTCYGYPCNDMTKCRKKIWADKTGTPGSSSAKIETLPPTREAFRENVLRAHIQVCIWRSALLPNPPELDPTKYGWVKDTENKLLVPVTLPSGVSAAPDDVLKLVRCGCAAEEPCTNKKCTCKKNNLPCTIFCNCSKEEAVCGNSVMALPTN